MTEVEDLISLQLTIDPAQAANLWWTTLVLEAPASSWSTILEAQIISDLTRRNLSVNKASKWASAQPSQANLMSTIELAARLFSNSKVIRMATLSKILTATPNLKPPVHSWWTTGQLAAVNLTSMMGGPLHLANSWSTTDPSAVFNSKWITGNPLALMDSILRKLQLNNWAWTLRKYPLIGIIRSKAWISTSAKRPASWLKPSSKTHISSNPSEKNPAPNRNQTTLMTTDKSLAAAYII